MGIPNVVVVLPELLMVYRNPFVPKLNPIPDFEKLILVPFPRLMLFLYLTAISDPFHDKSAILCFIQFSVRISHQENYIYYIVISIMLSHI